MGSRDTLRGRKMRAWIDPGMSCIRTAKLFASPPAGVPSDAEFAELEGVIRAGGGDPAALHYVRTLKRNNLTGGGPGGGKGGGGEGMGGGAAVASQSNLLDWAAQGLAQATKGVRTLLQGEKGRAGGRRGLVSVVRKRGTYVWSRVEGTVGRVTHEP